MQNSFHRLTKYNNNYIITNPSPFVPFGDIPKKFVSSTCDFALKMTFDHLGEHRAHRTGGTHHRKSGEIFANVFQGKLAEYALYNILLNKGIQVSAPNLATFGLGCWDNVDLMIGNKAISIKSTKSYGNLLLLEEKDWDYNANYIPNRKGYDFTVLTRIKPYCEDLMKKNHFLYSDIINTNILKEIIISESWSFDILVM